MAVSRGTAEQPAPTRVAAVLSPSAERAPLLRRVGALPEIELRVVSARRRTRRLVDRAVTSTLGDRRSQAPPAPDLVVAQGRRTLS